MNCAPVSAGKPAGAADCVCTMGVSTCAGSTLGNWVVGCSFEGGTVLTSGGGTLPSPKFNSSPLPELLFCTIKTSILLTIYFCIHNTPPTPTLKNLTLLCGLWQQGANRVVFGGQRNLSAGADVYIKFSPLMCKKHSDIVHKTTPLIVKKI